MASYSASHILVKHQVMHTHTDLETHSHSDTQTHTDPLSVCVWLTWIFVSLCLSLYLCPGIATQGQLEGPRGRRDHDTHEGGRGGHPAGVGPPPPPPLIIGLSPLPLILYNPSQQR
jgi:hypothetical protein